TRVPSFQGAWRARPRTTTPPLLPLLAGRDIIEPDGSAVVRGLQVDLIAHRAGRRTTGDGQLRPVGRPGRQGRRAALPDVVVIGVVPGERDVGVAGGVLPARPGAHRVERARHDGVVDGRR